MASSLPSIGSSGKYTLLEPFNAVVVKDASYTCVALRRLDEIIAAGGDPKSLYYDPYQLPDAAYTQDLNGDVSIVTIRSSAGDLLNIPSSFISGFPQGGGIPYVTYGLGLNLSAMPQNVDLTFLKKRMVDIVMETLGVETTIKTLINSPVTLIDSSTHTILEAAREAKITANETDRAALLRVQAELASAKQKITELENYIVAHPVP